jgi:hypothetical protein
MKMTNIYRQEIEANYTINNGVITSPGAFEGEALYVPYFWDLYLTQGADDDDGITLTFIVTTTDLAYFPELEGIEKLHIWQDDNGFVYCRAYARKERCQKCNKFTRDGLLEVDAQDFYVLEWDYTSGAMKRSARPVARKVCAACCRG